MKAIKFILTLSILSKSIIFTQVDEKFSSPLKDKLNNTFIEKYLPQGSLTDYKIISSNSEYIEIEYYPSNITKGKIYYKGEEFDVFDFSSSVSYDITSAGKPNLKYRSFNIAMPSDYNNSVRVLDYDSKEFSGINLAPVPFVNIKDPYQRSFENVYYSFIKGSEYSENKFLPVNTVVLEKPGNVRELTTAVLNLFPLQYNPVSRVMKVYTRLRVRVSFGSKPLPFNRQRSRHEIELLKDVALNSDLALNWLNPKYSSAINQSSLTSSVLASGDWYKIEIKDNGDDGKSEGIFKITKGYLDSAGINTSGIDPRKFKIYGNGGFMLPVRIEAGRPGDLQEICIYVEGENDGVFNEQDFILFYGGSINKWNYDTNRVRYQHYLNYYSRSNYYWLCFNTANNGKRMNIEASSSNSPQLIPSSFTEKLFSEAEMNNLLSEGNLWLSGGVQSGGMFNWNVTLKGLQAGSDILYRVKPASRCLPPYENRMLIKDDYSIMPELYFQMGNAYPGFGNWIWTVDTSFTINQSQKTNGEQVKFRTSYFTNSPTAIAYIDWWEIQYKRRLNSAENDFINFDSPLISGTVEYNVSSFSNNNVKVFDVTSHNNVKRIQPLNLSASNVKFRKAESDTVISRYFVVGQNGFKRPSGISSRLTNQNLRGISDGASFVIITDKEFMPSAARLKNKREGVGVNDPGYLKTKIVTTDLIYNEFSGGILDVTAIRDFLKYAYENWAEKPVYVLLFGDGHFNYKGLGGGNMFNPVPAFEITHPQLDQVAGYTTDDYFVNVTGGNIVPFDPNSDPPDMAVGRIPANTILECNYYLDKIDCYESGQYNGLWKNRMVFVADDQITTDGCEYGTYHLQQIEGLAQDHTPPTIDRRKIYSVTYPTVITPAGRRKPQVNIDIIKSWNEGAIDIHYTGHGSPDIWAHEYILERGNIMSQLNNNCKYPFVTIASCDMSKFDNPYSQSAGEEFMMRADKGAIGTLAATRPVSAQSNDILMKQFFEDLYIPRDTLLLPRRFGKALFSTKQIYYDLNALKYVLMCDPTLRIQVPRFRSKIDSISGLSNDTMRALSRIILYGSVLKADSAFWNNYIGVNSLKIYDYEKQIVIIDECPGITHSFVLNGGVIYSGSQNIVNGKWSAEFVVPKDISYRNNKGKIVNYFFNSQSDGSGIYTNFIVGGINSNAPIDTTGPVIKIFLNNRNFRSGDIVNRNFKLIGDLTDESGINTTGTIGHKIDAIMDGIENNKIDLTNFYNGDSIYKSGSLEYDFSGISEGLHKLRLKAWDTYNNSSEKEIEFSVSEGSTLNVINVYNYPNPFKDNTTFTFQHNFPEPVNVKIKIYTVAGRLIKEISQMQVNDKFVSIFWTGKDEDGETLGNGVYIYKLVVEAGGNQVITNIGKLAVLK